MIQSSSPQSLPSSAPPPFSWTRTRLLSAPKPVMSPKPSFHPKLPSFEGLIPSGCTLLPLPFFWSLVPLMPLVPHFAQGSALPTAVIALSVKCVSSTLKFSMCDTLKAHSWKLPCSWLLQNLMTAKLCSFSFPLFWYQLRLLPQLSWSVLSACSFPLPMIFVC